LLLLLLRFVPILMLLLALRACAALRTGPLCRTLLLLLLCAVLLPMLMLVVLMLAASHTAAVVRGCSSSYCSLLRQLLQAAAQSFPCLLQQLLLCGWLLQRLQAYTA
jgi:hypothetical protein